MSTAIPIATCDPCAIRHPVQRLYFPFPVHPPQRRTSTPKPFARRLVMRAARARDTPSTGAKR